MEPTELLLHYRHDYCTLGFGWFLLLDDRHRLKSGLVYFSPYCWILPLK